jgi:hypothetical protein
MKGIEVLHGVEYLEGLLRAGRLKFTKSIRKKVTYHGAVVGEEVSQRRSRICLVGMLMIGCVRQMRPRQISSSPQALYACVALPDASRIISRPKTCLISFARPSEDA